MGAENPFGCFDKYFLHAEFAPAMLTAAPGTLGLYAIFQKEASTLAAVVIVAATCGCAIPLCQFVKRRGRRVHERLMKEAGGLPSTRFLRHRDSTLPQQNRSRYHTKLALLVPGVVIPTCKEEEADPTKADVIYSSCVDKLREMTREATKFPLVLHANCEYGFRRNSRGMRFYGRISSLIGSALCGWKWTHLANSDSIILSVLISLAIAFMAIWWFFVVKDTYVHEAADEYGRRILATCDTLEPAAGAFSQIPTRSILLPHEFQEVKQDHI
jgi:hypothetical protein